MVVPYISEIKVNGLLLDELARFVATGDDAGTIVIASQQLYAMFGYHPGEMIGKCVDELVPPDVRLLHRTHRTRWNADPRKMAMGERSDVRFMKKTGETMPARVQLIPYYEDGKLYAVGLVSEIKGGLAAMDSGAHKAPTN